MPTAAVVSAFAVVVGLGAGVATAAFATTRHLPAVRAVNVAAFGDLLAGSGAMVPHAAEGATEVATRAFAVCVPDATLVAGVETAVMLQATVVPIGAPNWS